MKSIRNQLLIIVVISFMFNGCAPLKKKFIRQKKKDKAEAFIPVLDPVDYPAPVYSAKKKYAYHYSLWRVWSRDLLQAFGRDSNKKNQKYLLGQIKIQMEEMKKLISVDKKKELDVLVGEIDVIEGVLNKPVSSYNNRSIKKKLQVYDKKMRNAFKPALITEYDTVH